MNQYQWMGLYLAADILIFGVGVALIRRLIRRYRRG